MKYVDEEYWNAAISPDGGIGISGVGAVLSSLIEYDPPTLNSYTPVHPL